MASRTGIELLPHACRVVEVQLRARLFRGGLPEPPRVRAFSEIPWSDTDPAELTHALRQAVQGRGRRAAVTVWGLRSSHQTLLLPPASPADLEMVARREARAAPGGLPPPPLADVVVPGPVRDGPRETGYAAVSAEELRTRLQPLVDAGITVCSVVTPALAHASIVRQRRPLLPDAAMAVLSVNARATALTVVRSPVVLLARELPWGYQTESPGGERNGAGSPAFLSRLVSELRRSLVYLRQGRKIEIHRLLVCGDVPELRALTGPLVNELAVDVETLDMGDDLDLSALPEPSDLFRSRLGSWRTALALAADPSRLPGLEVHEPGGAVAVPVLVRRAAVAAAAGALVTASGWAALGYLTAGVTARQEHLRRTVGILEPELRRLNDEQHAAAVAAARGAALSAFASQGPRLARVIEAFGLAAPADLALSAIRVEPGDASWRVTAEGQAEGADAAAAHETLNRFVKALDASPVLGRPAAPPSIRARATGEASGLPDAGAVRQAGPLPPAAAPRRPASAVEFTLHYEVPK